MLENVMAYDFRNGDEGLGSYRTRALIVAGIRRPLELVQKERWSYRFEQRAFRIVFSSMALNEKTDPLFEIARDLRIGSRIIETNARRPLSALVFASVFPPKNTVVSTMFPQLNAKIMHSAEMVGKFFAQAGRKTAQFSQKLAKRIFALSGGLNGRVRIPSGAAGFIQPASA